MYISLKTWAKCSLKFNYTFCKFILYSSSCILHQYKSLGGVRADSFCLFMPSNITYTGTVPVPVQYSTVPVQTMKWHQKQIHAVIEKLIP